MVRTFTGIVSLILILFNLQQAQAANYYWVGGTGSWTDLTHWATTSGGTTKHTALPTSADDVFFDANSFTATGQTVTITDGANCKNMSWTGAINSPTIYAFVGDALNIYGSLTLPSTVLRNFAGNLYFKSTTTGNTVDLGGQPLRNPNNETLYFEGAGGAWTLTGGINIYAISFKGGTLNTNGQPVTCSVFGATGSTAQTLNLGSSAISAGTWNITSTNITVVPGTSTITSTGTVAVFNGKGLTYNNLIIDGTSSVSGSNTFGTITINAGSTLKLKEGTTQTITGLVSNGTSGSPVTIKSVTDGSAATLSKASGTVSVNYARIQDNIATGGATFSAPVGSVDLGNVTGWNITVSEPTQQVTAFAFSKVLPTSVELKWTNGNGAKRLVLVRAVGAVDAAPTDGTVYTAAAFPSGSSFGPTSTKNFVVYAGNASKATITGLFAGTVYYFAVYEYNESGGVTNYNITSAPTLTTTMLPSTAVIISNSPVTVCSGQYFDTGGDDNYNYNVSESFTQTLTPATAGNLLKLDFNAYDFYLGTGDVLKIYDGANTSATLIGSYTGGTLPGTAGVVTATNDAGQLTIQFTSDANITSIGWGATISCVVPPLATEPGTSASALQFSNVTNNSMTLSWTNGNGNNRIVIARAGAAVAFTPVDATSYTANAAYASGTSLGSNQYVVYNGNGNSVNVTNLAANGTYYFSVFEYNKASGTTPNYRTTTPATGNKVTLAFAAEPTTPATGGTVSAGMSDVYSAVNWTNGNGVRRVLVVKQGSPVDVFPVDGTLYTTPSDLSMASGTDLGSGNKVIYSGSGTSSYIYGLTPLTTYYFAVFEFNGTTAGTTNYLTTTPATGSFTTLATAPSANPGMFASTTITSSTFNSVNLQWAPVSGVEKYLVVFQKTVSSYSVTDGVEYAANPIYGQGYQIGSPDSYVVYSGSGTSVNVTGLQSGTQYTMSIYSFNGNGKTTNYVNNAQGRSVTTLKYKPTAQPTSVSVTYIAADSMRISWVGGNGDNSVVVMRAGQAVNASIKDSTELNIYNSGYGEGVDFGNGNTAVYRGSASSVLVTKLAPSTTYYISVYEYNSNSVSEAGVSKTYSYFQLTNPATTSATTLAGKNYYWVGGTGKWSDYQHHWATTSGGTTYHTKVPSGADNLYFDAASFSTDKDSVILDQNNIYFRDMDWTAITKKATFSGPKGSIGCTGFAEAYGSVKLSDLMTINLYSITFRSTYKGNVINFGSKKSTSTSCLGSYSFWGYGGEWTLAGDLNVSNLTFYAGTLISNNATITSSNGISFYNLTPKRLELGNSVVNVAAVYGATEVNNTQINGGRFVINSTYSSVPIELGRSHIKKIAIAGTFYNTARILGTVTIDSLSINPGREVQFEAGKTFTIDKMIVNGDSSKTTLIRSTKTGVAANFVKTSGSIDLKYVFLKDNNASGGAQFNAASSVNLGNVTGWNITVPEVFLPKKSASGLVFRKVLRTNLKMKWTSGDGMRRIVIAKENGPVDAYPQDNKTYTASVVFGSGSDLGNGNFVVYEGISDTTSVTSLAAGKSYHFAILEYNTWSGKTKYRRTVPATANTTMVGATDILFSNSPVSACNVKFFDDGGNGFYTRDKSLVQTITPATAGAKLGVLFTYFEMPVFDSLIVYDGTSVSSPAIGKFRYTYSKPTQALIATNASGALTFQLKGNNSSESDDAFKGWAAELFCVGTTVAEPTTQGSGLAITTKTESALTLKATKGNGAGRVIIAREASAVSKFPADGLGVTSSSVFGQGMHLGDGNYVVYSGQDESVIVSGLKGNTLYNFASIEYNGSQSNINYLLANPATAKDTTLVARPTIASNSLSFYSISKNSVALMYNAGNGSSRLVVVRKSKPVAFVPTDGKTYAYNQSLNSGNIGDSTYIVSNNDWGYGLGTFAMEQGTTYYYRIFDYNGSGSKIKYLTTASLTGSVRTLGPVITLKKINSIYCPNEAIQVPFVVSSAFNEGNKLKLQLSDAQGSFASLITLKDTTITALTGSIKSRIPNTVAGGTNYKVRILSTSPAGASDSIRTISIPVVPDVTITQNGSGFVSSVATGVQWYRGGVAINGATSPTFSSVDDGVYTVRVSVGNCYKTSNAIVIMGLEDTNAQLSVYPNPVNDELTIERPAESAPAKFQIFDTQGRQITQGTLNEARTNVGVKEFAQGVYFIKVISENASTTTKFIRK